ncbi:MAG: hypothetical protein OXB84_00260 [Halobacteriovoraceae bacterium]|nr:hypothetical protein [Halobacteriovoraceae bacterium]
MELLYIVNIADPQTHMVKVRLKGRRKKSVDKLVFFLPSWSPGSYLMREYARHLRGFEAEDEKGKVLNYRQIDKGAWEVDWKSSDQTSKNSLDFQITYEVYCHELTVRTSCVDVSHTFLHGPTYLMGIEGQNLADPKIQLEFPALWSKVATGLSDISPSREKFVYTARNYDQLIDSPIEIGCHESDGFKVEGVDHELAFYGTIRPHEHDLKKDIKTIVSLISSTMGDIPYERYVFIAHFIAGFYGGLEHNNSTVVHFDGTRLGVRKDYLDFLCLISHEYFHTWNIKRIRPRELGPFNYRRENHTKMLWLAEGLTSFMDTLFVYRAGLMKLEEYLEIIKKDINRYLDTPGRRFHSLEDSSFNAWIKLYRPDENTRNSTVSYYTKGGIVFFALNALFTTKAKSVNDLLKMLWSAYKKNPSCGLEDKDIYEMVEKIAGEDVRNKFETMIISTEEIDLPRIFQLIGAEIEFNKEKKTYLGMDAEFRNDRVFVKYVKLDGPAFRSGINVGDELLFIDNIRIVKNNYASLSETLKANHTYETVVCRHGNLLYLNWHTGETPPKIEKINISNKEKLQKSLMG